MRSLALLTALALVGCNKDPDADGDGYSVEEGGDCDDADPSVHPGADERCNGVDDDCDGRVDEEAVDRIAYYADGDGDGYGEPSESKDRCEPPEGWVPDGTDCDDTDPGVHPGADEVCDEVDQDCDGEVDEEAVDAPTWYLDEDADGYGVDGSTVASCGQPEGYAPTGGDCDDHLALAHPGMWERCDTDFDDDCDGEINEDEAVDAPFWYEDADGDGYGSPEEAPRRQCLDPGEGWSGNELDCDDADPAVSPEASEYCNGIDDDCDGDVDEDDAVDAPTWYSDTDGDGYGDPDAAATACEQPSGWLADDSDCDDADADVYPGSLEVCDDGVDQDCDGTADSGCHCGVIATDETWDASTTHIVWCDVEVYDFAAPVLTVEDGATVLFEAGTAMEVGVSGPGSLDVQGTSSGVLFSSYESSPAEGDWRGLEIGAYDEGSSLVGLTLEYGGSSSTAGLTLSGADVSVEDSLIQLNAGGGILIEDDAEPTLTGTEVSWNDGTGIDASDGGLDLSSRFEDNTLTSNVGYPLELPATYATCLDDSSTYTGNLDDHVVLGTGTVQSTGTMDALDAPWYLDGTLSVAGSASPVLTLADGLELEMAPDAGIRVGESAAGSLVVDGSSSGVLISSAEASPAAGDWKSLYFGSHDAGSELTGLLVEYGGGDGHGCLTLEGAEVSVDDSVISACDNHGLYATDGAVAWITDTDFDDCALDGVHIAADASLGVDTSPSFTGNTIDGSGAYPLTVPADSVGMVGTNTLTSSGSEYLRVLGGTVTTDATWLVQDVPLLLTGDVAVEGSASPTLTLEDGQELVFAASVGLSVGWSDPGSLVAEGTSSGIFLYGQTATAGSWDGLAVGAYADTAWLEGVSLSHGGANGYGSLLVDGADVVLVDSSVDDSDPNGIWVASGSLDADGSAITDSKGTGIYVGASGELLALDGCESTGHTDYPLSLPASSVGVLDTTSTLTGNGVDAVEVRGGVVSEDATWAALDLPYLLTDEVSVYGSATPLLEIEAGATLEFDTGVAMSVAVSGPGALSAEGTSADPILFTSAQATPGRGDWRGLYLGSLCDDSLTSVSWSTVEYGGANGKGNVVFDACDATLSDSTIQYSSSWGAYRLNGASPSLSDMTWNSNKLGSLY